MAQRINTSTGLHTFIQYRHGLEELHITRVGSNCMEVREVAASADGAQIVRADVFGPYSSVEQEPGFPVTRICNEETDGAALTGVYVHAVRGGKVEHIVVGGRVVGAVVTTPYAVECTLAGITTCDISRDRTQQAWQTFEAIEDALAHANMDWSHVVRTWLFIDRILEWYGEFNAARTAFYKDRGVFERLLPASTGIGGSNPRGAAVLAAALAIKPRAADVTAEAVESPLQCPATRYASSFSRAVEVCMPDCRRLFVSGTASIDRDGRTIHVGDAYSQIAWTFDVVQALLESRGMHWADVTRATAYLRFAADALTLRRFLDARPDLSHLPLVVANNVICRRDLLFELEVDASR